MKSKIMKAKNMSNFLNQAPFKKYFASFKNQKLKFC